MSFKIYSCENTGDIQVLSPEDYSYDIETSQFCIVRKYKAIYDEMLPRFADFENTPYALPAKNKAMQLYNGTDREPLEYTPDDFHEYNEKQAVEYFDLITEQDAELIFIRIAGCDDTIPDGLSFYGYDVCWSFDEGSSDGFSAICDCMFLCRWHGCDDEGTEFSEEFRLLNNNGLIDSARDAYNYMIHYLNRDWSERGEYCIYEIYGR